jgi:antibiotic biosynthesis monooxygenase (ABM) superfamily enzyme
MTTLAPAATPVPARRAGPNKLRFAVLVLIGVYPLVTGISYAIAPLTAGWPIWQRGLLLTPIMVPAMVYGLIPFIQTRFGRWLIK